MASIPITEFKAKCLQIFRDVEEGHQSIAIEKRGKIIAQVVPVAQKSNGGYGCMSDSFTIKGDLTSPLEEEWNVNE